MLTARVYLVPEAEEYFSLRRMGKLTDVITMQASETFEVDRNRIGVMWFCALCAKNTPEMLIDMMFTPNDKLSPTMGEAEHFSSILLYEIKRSLVMPLEMYERKIGMRFFTQSGTFYFEHRVGRSKEE